MARTIRYSHLFESDVLDAATWYDARHPELGREYVECVRQAVDLILTDPDRRAPDVDGIRYWPVKRFPYIVFYDLTDREILMLGVLHTARDSRKWIADRDMG
jgi:toxin ParE1/3/4